MRNGREDLFDNGGRTMVEAMRRTLSVSGDEIEQEDGVGAVADRVVQ
jgi:hypothetical protein